jgi:hypothetical protein
MTAFGKSLRGRITFWFAHVQLVSCPIDVHPLMVAKFSDRLRLGSHVLRHSQLRAGSGHPELGNRKT